MAKDPAFLFYPGDASEDTQFMNRLERGCYFDILKAQKKFEKFTIDQLKKVLGNDFTSCWPAIELVLKKEGEYYFIEWVAEKIEERKNFSESRRKNRKSKTSDKDMSNTSQSLDKDMVIEDGVVDEDNNTIVCGQKNPSKPLIKIKRKYMTDKNFLIYGEDGYEEMMVMETTRGVPDAEKPFVQKFMRDKNGCVYEGSPSFVINSFKAYIKNQFS